ncbi:hypothetical protein IEO21_08021 [Rhodonia placenta]|uniref:Uncharacterized protein n=1 Tax=Rhodonia placenta TaxID=104341 RepID=A0A8H7NX24_9APHY|nr:hypothetical protein IEO21_08021 [Postia placenta]
MNSPVEHPQILHPQIIVVLDRHSIIQNMVLNAVMKIKDHIELVESVGTPSTDWRVFRRTCTDQIAKARDHRVAADPPPPRTYTCCGDYAHQS